MTCKRVNVCGRARKLCWSKGKITSNKPFHGGKSAGRKASSSRKGGATKCRKANGQIKKGCRMSKSGRLTRVR